MDKEVMEQRLATLIALQDKLKLDVEEQEIYIQAMKQKIAETN